MSIATLFYQTTLLPQKKLEVGRKKSFFIGIPKKPVTKNAVFVSLQMPLTLSFNGHRVMIESGAGESSVMIKNIAMLVQR
jgi:alanine dehydrogenase